MGLDREETLMMIGDTMVIPIAPAPSGPEQHQPRRLAKCCAAMPRRCAGWGWRSRLANLKQRSPRGSTARGFTLHFDPGMEEIYFLVGRKQALGVRLESSGDTTLPNDPRPEAGLESDALAR